MKNKKIYINMKKRKTPLTITFSYEKDSIMPDEILVDGSKCTLCEMMLALMRLYEAIREQDPTQFLVENFQNSIQEGLKSGALTPKH